MIEKGKKKICPESGKEFQCLQAPGCWCEKYDLSQDALKELAVKYGDCLCEEKLKEWALDEGKNSPSST